MLSRKPGAMLEFNPCFGVKGSLMKTWQSLENSIGTGIIGKIQGRLTLA